MVRGKLRIRFRKDGDLRLISHHDLMRCFERMLRRAALPFHSTEGFNPKPRLVFALSLALGIIGHEEVVELELDADLPPEEVRQRLAAQAPAGLTIVGVCPINPKVTACVSSVTYRMTVPPERMRDLPSRIAMTMEAANLSIERTRPQARRLDIRPYLGRLSLLPDAVEMHIIVTPTGTARPEEVLAQIGLDDLLNEGAVLERTHMDLVDEKGALVQIAESRESAGAGQTASINQPEWTEVQPHPAHAIAGFSSQPKGIA